ncbi:EamA family transporter [Celerinatantimonas yamalensis]|uniref:EamA family transporter n=1 Tax=Celerinatantimonas yamalensis TaxID=559956 RepID=A0ABW9G6X1_9GAMM
MPIKDMLLALAVVIAWGVNFVVIKVGLEGMPPLLLAGLRFACVAFPAIFFIAPPKLPLRWLVSYGLSISFGQFSLLFLSIKLGMPAGLASLILQAQAFFTLLFGAVLLKESLRLHNLLAMAIAAIGIALIGLSHSHYQNSFTLPALLLILGAAASWGIGNITNKVIMARYSVKIMSLVVWSALVPLLAFSLSSVIFEGTSTIYTSLVHIQWHNILALFYLAVIATMLGYGCWGSLLSRYETWRIAPLTLLVPVVGLVSAAVFVNEHLSTQQLVGAAIVGIALVFNVFGARLLRARSTPPVNVSNRL